MNTPKKIGRYEILGELGHGAMGTVYRAKDPAMDRVVALKTIMSIVLASEQGGEFRERFYREARAAGSLNHPGIVPVYDVGEHEGLPFLVMEFISGKTLADRVKKGERIPLGRVCEIGQKIAEALGYAHEHGVIHRDIKPANILLTSREEHGIERPKITDFGVAKLAAGQTTMTGQMVGTPAYMPPEQFTGAPIDGRADIFSLGVVLYWLATSEQPFPGESMTAVSYKVVHTDPVPPRKLNPSVSAKLDSIILKCLAKNPDDRYQTGADLARALGEARNAGKSVGVSSTAPTTASHSSDPNATLYDSPGAPVAAAAAPPAPRTADSVSPPNRKSNKLPVLAAVGIVVIVAGGWVLFGRKDDEPASVKIETPSYSVSVQDPGNAEPSVEVKSAGSNPKKSDATVAVGIKAPPVRAETPAPKTETAPAEPAAVDFNPKTLDPKANAKLRIEADRIPLNLDFSVEMNGQLYLQRSTEGNQKDFDNLYVPPGVQEFRVTAGSGSLRKTSNTVSTEFKPKKKHTLKIELRTLGGTPGSGMPQDLYADTQIVLTLK
jgi:serine/threonine protein kinase